MTKNSHLAEANEASRRAWEANAAHWDEYMGVVGNDFVNLLVWPATARLLAIQCGERVLDVACGNGLYSLRMAGLGARVVGFDFSAELVARAKERSAAQGDQIAYHVVDATDLNALLALGEGQYDAAACQMALMDMAELAPLAAGLRRLLRSGGRFVFATMHPCFNGLHTTLMTETADNGQHFATKFFLKLSSYMTPFTAYGSALRNQPQPQPYFHRPLHALLAPFFGVGFVLDALEEAAFPPDNRPDKMASWGGNYSEFPPALVVRLRNP
jgi:2-polyprenyl-3-methyl-5-hydroxy-6-metoxy-1,4-benzoquinol methylase